MQWLEYQAKAVARRTGVPVPAGDVAGTADEAVRIATRLDRPLIAVKAQVPIGGRGKAGGIVVVPVSEVAGAARRLLAGSIKGHAVESVLVEEGVDAVCELYLGIAIDAPHASSVLLLSARGGVEVEADAAAHLSSTPIPADIGLRPWHVWSGARSAAVPAALVPGLIAVARDLYRVFVQERAELVEINPLMSERGGRLVAADIRLVPSEDGSPPAADDVSQIARRELDFDFIELNPDGQIGLLTTGAGASMLVSDLLTEAGQRPINFCDLRAGRVGDRDKRLRFVLTQLARYPRLSCIAINVFAGITDLEGFAEQLADVLPDEAPAVPIVARLEGRGATAARSRLNSVGIRCVSSLGELIAEAVALATSCESSTPRVHAAESSHE